MIRKFCVAFFAAVLAALPSFAADLVSDYTVSEDGTTYTRSEGWSAKDDGITVVFKYANLPSDSEANFITISQYAPAESKVGLCSKAKVLQGTWGGGYWNDSQNTDNTSALDDSGIIVAVYKPSASQGLIAYDAEGSTIFSASKLKSTTTGSTVGKKIVFTEFVTDVAIYKGAVAAEEVAALVTAFNQPVATSVYEPFLTTEYVQTTIRAESLEDLLAASYSGTMKGGNIGNGSAAATGYFVTKSSDNELTVELQAINSETKCVLAKLQLDDDGYVWVKAVKAAWMSTGTTLGTRFFNDENKVDSAYDGTVVTSTTGKGYGIVDLTIVGKNVGDITIPEGALKYGYDFNGTSFTKEDAASSSLNAAKSNTIVASQSNGALILGNNAGSHYGDSGFSYGTGDWSIAAVVMAPGANEVIYAMGGSKTVTGLIGLRYAGNNKIEAFTSNGNTITGVTLPEDPMTAYHLYTVVYSNGQLQMNVDGGEFTEAVEFTTGTGVKWQFGGIHGGEISSAKNATNNQGALDEFRVYTTALNREQTYKIAEEFDLVGGEDIPVFDPDKDEVATEAALRFSEIMPKPSDKPYSITTQAGYDKNGLESGWVELENTSDKWVNLKDYKFCRANRGKVYTHADYGNFPEVMIPPRGRYTFYTSERYSNSASAADSAWQNGTFDGKPIFYNDMLIWGDKINPKKYPYVTLVYKPEGAAKDTILETVIIPSDTPEGYSIIVGEKDETSYTKRWLCSTPTFNKANSDTSKLTAIGPNVGPQYGIKHSVSEFVATAPAKSGEVYPVSLNVNPVYDGTAQDAIAKVVLVYRTKLGKGVEDSVEMKKTGTDAGGDVWTAEIPASAIPTEPGQLIQWKTKITDASGNEWTSPSFMNKDDGYEWYGTITEPTGMTSAKLPTWHMFADDDSKTQMDKDVDAQDLSKVPNYARVAIYDSSTSHYYDYVRIDLRGHTSASFTKKGHGLRFSKVNPLTMTDVVTGEDVKEIRKTSLISEFADPSYIRQMLSFWLFNQAKSPAPFDFPVRCNLNGEFYQVAFNSERFTDELIEDVYGLDKYGYGYKNIGTFAPGGSTSAGSIEKKTPDDGNESDISRLSAFTTKLSAASQVSKGKDASSDTKGLENDDLTKVVATEMDLPAWFNYLAIARITSECDDVWANLSGYCDEAEMKEGRRGTSTWRPLVYDTNLSWGQHYNDGSLQRGLGLKADQDWFKSHPFYGGFRIRAHENDTLNTTVGNANYAVEAIWQHEKYRRLYLRRLRTLMDEFLGETAEGATLETDASPIVAQMRIFAELLREDAADDLKKWPYDSSDNAIDNWTDANRPKDMDEGIQEIYNNYILPRRTHLFVTHAETNDAVETGYATLLKAGIPAKQSPISELKDKITISGLTELSDENKESMQVDSQFYRTDMLMILNSSDEDIDMSGWKLEFSVDFTLPAGTVCPNHGYIYVVSDRVDFISKLSSITDQIVIGNAQMTGAGPIRFTAADGTVIVEKIPRTDERDYLRLDSFCGNTSDPTGDVGEWFTLKNISDSVTLNLKANPVTVCFLKDDAASTENDDHCHITISKGSIAPGGTLIFKQADYEGKGWVKIQNNKQVITISDKYGTTCQQLKVTQKNYDLAYGNGAYLKHDGSAWSQIYDLAIGTTVYTRDQLEEVAAQFADGLVIRLGVDAVIDEDAQTITFAADKVLTIPSESYTIAVADQKAGMGTKQITLTEVVDPSAGEIPDGVEPLTGDIGDITLDAGIYYLNGANFTGVITCNGAVTFHLVTGSENTAKSIVSSGELTIKGSGLLSMEGEDTLIMTPSIVVNDGILSLVYRGTVAESAAIEIGNVENAAYGFIQNGGTVAIDLFSEVTVYGVHAETKKVQALFNGGTFTTTVASGDKSATFKLGKGSNNVVFDGTEVRATLVSAGARFVQTKAKITVNAGVIDLTSDANGGPDIRALKATETIAVNGGLIRATLAAEAGEAMSADDTITIAGGIQNLVTTDDALSAGNHIVVTGGILYAQASASDALDSNGDMTISGGYVLAFTTSTEHEALDVDPSEDPEAVDNGIAHKLYINEGATVVAVGGLSTVHGPDEGSTANCYVGTGLALEGKKKYLELTGVTTDEVNKITTVGTFNLNNKSAAEFSLIATIPGMTGEPVFTATKPETGKLSEEISGMFVNSTTEELPSKYPEGALVITEAGDYTEQITGETTVIVDVGEGNVVTFTQGNSFTGGLEIWSGTAKQTVDAGNGNGGFGANGWNSRTYYPIVVKEGATLDLGYTKDACYAVTTAGNLVNSVGEIGNGSRQMAKLTLEGDVTASGYQFGLLAPGYDQTELDFGGHTLTVDIRNGTNNRFLLSNVTVKNPGAVKIVNGKLWLNKTITGTIPLDLSGFPKDGGVVAVRNSKDTTDAVFDSITLAEGEDQDRWSLKVENNQLIAVYTALAEENETAEEVGLMISEIMPKASVWDENHCDSGWLEVVNTHTDKNVQLADYSIARFNRGKPIKSLEGWVNGVNKLLAPGERLVIKTSEDYPHGDDKTITRYPEMGKAIVLAAKVNPKKYPLVVLTKNNQVVQSCVVPVDVPEDQSIVFECGDLNGAKVSYIAEATKGAAPKLEKAIPVGPQITSLYAVDKATDPWIAFPPATPETDYEVALPVNPIYGGNNKNAIEKVQLIYQIGFGAIVTNDTAMTIKAAADKLNGCVYTGTIPGTAIKGEGQLVRWAVKITDAAGNEWRSPSFNNPEDGYEWYGTITTPSADQTKGKITTLHLFAPEGVADIPGSAKRPSTVPLMNIDADDAAFKTAEHPYGAYVGIYDNDTGMYYDKVRIDKRGNTSGAFTKKAHGLKFAKSQPFTGVDSVTGKTLSGIRKSSFTAEYGDPSFVRQSLAFATLRENGSQTPFHYPVRLNLNGEFYQLAFHSERFSDELIEDLYGLDPKGYGYKNVGSFNPNLKSVTGGIEKKTPDDGVVSDGGVLKEFCNKMSACDDISELNTKDVTEATPDSAFDNEFSAELTKVVAEDFDLPAWLNYIALTKITGETDDVWGNISAYYDINKTGTWMPLAYDMNQSLGDWHIGDDRAYASRYSDGSGLCPANDDHTKAHPLYGGLHIMVHYSGGAPYSKANNGTTAVKPYKGNRCFESIFQNAKYRRLYLRRLRTLMDAEFGGIDAAKEDTPIYQRAAEMVARYSEVAAMDRAIWTDYVSSTAAIWIWGNRTFTAEEGLEEMWENYIVPRRQHLYVSHGVADPKGKGIGYGETLCAGIPEAQSPISQLKDGISAEYDAALDAMIIKNANNEVIDMSGWTLVGPVQMTLPAGTVIDQGTKDAPGIVYVAVDRKATIAKMTMTDQVVIGNAAKGSSYANIGLAAGEEDVIPLPPPTEQATNIAIYGLCGAPATGNDGEGEFIILTNTGTTSVDVGGLKVNICKQADLDSASKCSITIVDGTTIASGEYLRLEKKDKGTLFTGTWSKITDGELRILLADSTGVVYYAYEPLSQEGLSLKNVDMFALHNLKKDTWSAVSITEAPGYVAPTKTWEEATEITDETSMSELVPEAQATTLTNLGVKPTTLAKWAKTHHAADTLGTEIDLVAFALNCATSEVEAKKEDFKVTITIGEDGKVTVDPTIELNIKPTIKGAAEVNGEYKADYGEDARFFKAIIQIGD